MVDLTDWLCDLFVTEGDPERYQAQREHKFQFRPASRRAQLPSEPSVCPMESSLGGVSGVGGLARELMNLATVIRWRWSRDLVLRFYLLVQVFETTLQNTRSPQAFKNEAVVRSLRSQMEEIKSKPSEEEAGSWAQVILGQMMNIMETLQAGPAVYNIPHEWEKLDPRTDPSIRNLWESAKKDRKLLDSRSPAATSKSTPVQSSLSNIQLSIHISLTPHGPIPDLGAPSPRKIAFPAPFGRFSFANLLAYTLAHPKNPSSSPAAPQNPIKFASMNTFYLRSMDFSNQPARWRPIVLHNELTLQEYLDTAPQPEIRFLSSKIRFVLVSSNESGNNLERTFDLNSMSECQAMKRYLDQAWVGCDPSSATDSSTSAISANQPLAGSGSKPSWNFPPRTCVVLVGPGSFEVLSP
ncbi:hypothetical protein FRC01_001537 [Tulasnella sp. 417]|nr:hypothetical protein FRC01_001537 [Tulasnella sp. 417]